jgi:hypothetical protein
MNVQIGDTLQVPVHPNAPKPQRGSRSLVMWGLVAIAAIGVSVFVGTRLRGNVAATSTSTSANASVSQTVGADIATVAPAISAAPAVSSVAPPPSVSVASTALPPPTPRARKLEVALRSHGSLQYDVRTVERIVAPLRPRVQQCVEQHPPHTIPAALGVDLELWSLGDQVGKVRDVRVQEPPALSKCLYDVFISVSMGPPKDPRMPPAAVFVSIDVTGS